MRDPANRLEVAGDEGTGRYSPRAVAADFERIDAVALREISRVHGLTATASDVLDEMGCRLAVSADVLSPRSSPGRSLAGQALTLRYLPERMDHRHARVSGVASKLAHHSVFELAGPGDVVVIEAGGGAMLSSLGGMAAAAAVDAGVAGCIVDGGVRDVDEIVTLGLPVWSRYLTPVTGKWRLEAAEINAPVCCGGVQARPGDLVLADDTGVCFVPVELAGTLIERVLEVSRHETAKLGEERGQRGGAHGRAG